MEQALFTRTRRNRAHSHRPGAPRRCRFARYSPLAFTEALLEAGIAALSARSVAPWTTR
jgi:hypothetical protein